MKQALKYILSLSVLCMFVAACDKVADLKTFGPGTDPVLNSSSLTFNPLPADSDNVAMTFSWTNPHYSNSDSATSKYILQVDSIGRNFSKAVEKTVLGSLSTSYTNKQFNNILLGFGFSFNVAYDVQVRLISSYGNNNERRYSNILTIHATPYKVPPKIALPASLKLFIVGDATAGGWNNPVPVPSQELARLDETTWGGVFDLVGGKQYLLLPVNGDWSHKYSVANNSLPGLSGGGDFGYDLSDNFPGPATTGTYKVIVDFQHGTFSVTPYTGPQMPSGGNLFIVGDATAGGWNNPVPVPSQQLTRENNAVWSLTNFPMVGGKEYLLLPVNGDWSHKYSVQDNTLPGLNAGGSFGYDLPQNFPGPTASGNYKLTVNFVTGKFSVQ